MPTCYYMSDSPIATINLFRLTCRKIIQNKSVGVVPYLPFIAASVKYVCMCVCMYVCVCVCTCVHVCVKASLSPVWGIAKKKNMANMSSDLYNQCSSRAQ